MTAEQEERFPAGHSEAPASEARDLAQELGQSFGTIVALYCEHFGLTPEEARPRTLDAAGEVERIQSTPPDQISWMDLHTLERHTPGQAQVQWEKIKEAARKEIQNGHRAARALEGGESRCWDRARFLALRSELLDSVRPRTAIEGMLVDQLALWQVQLWEWQETTAAYSSLLGARSARRNEGIPELLRLTDAEAVEKAMKMVERFQKLYLQTFKVLQAQCKVGAPAVARCPEQAEQGNLQLKVYA